MGTYVFAAFLPRYVPFIDRAIIIVRACLRVYAMCRQILISPWLCFPYRFYAITFPADNMKYSYISAVVVSFGGALSSFLGGRVVDRWEKAGQPAASTSMLCAIS